MFGPEKSRRREGKRTRRAAKTPTRVIDVMARDPVVVAPYLRVGHAEGVAAARGIHHLLVVESGQLLGVLCLCDLWHAPAGAEAGERMSTPAATIDPFATLQEAVDAMNELAVGCLPVLEGDCLVGIVTRGDLWRAGAMGPDAVRRCAACGTRHHVRGDLSRREPESGIAFCVECLERGRAFDCEDPYEELGDVD